MHLRFLVCEQITQALQDGHDQDVADGQNGQRHANHEEFRSHEQGDGDGNEDSVEERQNAVGKQPLLFFGCRYRIVVISQSEEISIVQIAQVLA